jgi:hypothetical protein
MAADTDGKDVIRGEAARPQIRTEIVQETEFEIGDARQELAEQTAGNRDDIRTDRAAERIRRHRLQREDRRIWTGE